jgi:glutathione S-transferase
MTEINRPKLVYFNLKGLAETSRILFALANVDYEDFRFPFEVIDASEHKFDRKEFEEARENGLLKGSMSKLPFLEVHDDNGSVHVISQSKAVERYISRKYGLMGSNEIEAARIDAVCESVRDLKDAYQKVKGTEGAKNSENSKIEAFFTEGLLESLKKLEGILDYNTFFAIGNKLSLADVTIYNFLVHYFDRNISKLLKEVPRLGYIAMKVHKRHEVKDWLAKRQKTIF